MRSYALVVLVVLLGCGRPADTATKPASSAAAAPQKVLSLARVQPRRPGVAVRVVSDALGADGALDLRNSAYGANLSPPLRWTPVAGADAYALILEDPDAPGDRPLVHWLIWNIPGGTASLPEGLPNSARLATPPGAVQGRNHSGTFGYAGPRPPPGDGPHHYHFQLFALDGPLLLKPEDADLPALVSAMSGRVLADGELVGVFQAPARR